MKQVVDEIVMLEIYPRSEINIVVHVLESDGSIICCIINAICLALMEAGIAMSDIVVACSAGFVQKELCVDLTLVEQNAGGAYLPIVMKARSEEIVYMQLDCRLSLDLLDDAMQKSIVGCRKVKAYIESAIRKRMSSIAEVGR
jgi:exosome complex component RRP41